MSTLEMERTLAAELLRLFALVHPHVEDLGCSRKGDVTSGNDANGPFVRAQLPRMNGDSVEVTLYYRPGDLAAALLHVRWFSFSAQVPGYYLISLDYVALGQLAEGDVSKLVPQLVS